MTELFNKEGQVVEAYTQEEVEQKLDEIRQSTKSEVESQKNEEIENLNLEVKEKDEAITQLREDLEKEKSKDKNLTGQRRIIEEKEKKIEGLETGMKNLKEEMEKRLTEIANQGKEKMVKTMINELARGEKNVAEKIEFWYKKFAGEPADETEIQERVKNAYTLATGGKATIPITGPVISAAGGTPVINPTGEKFSSELTDLAHRMGISDKELKKHGYI